MKIQKAGLVCLVVFAGWFGSCRDQRNGRDALTAVVSSPSASWERFALLIIDVQEDFWNEYTKQQFPDFPANVTKLLKLCRREGIEVIHLRARFKPDMSDWPSFYKLRGTIPCVAGTKGAEVVPFAKATAKEKVFYKHSFDGFYETRLLEYLRQRNIKHLLLAGIATEVCVLNTALSAFQRGFLLTLVEDCSAGSLQRHKFVASGYNGFIFDSVGHGKIVDQHTRWMDQINRLEKLETGAR